MGAQQARQSRSSVQCFAGGPRVVCASDGSRLLLRNGRTESVYGTYAGSEHVMGLRKQWACLRITLSTEFGCRSTVIIESRVMASTADVARVEMHDLESAHPFGMRLSMHSQHP